MRCSHAPPEAMHRNNGPHRGIMENLRWDQGGGLGSALLGSAGYLYGGTLGPDAHSAPLNPPQGARAVCTHTSHYTYGVHT